MENKIKDVSEKIKWGIRLRSKHTGEEITLGSQYKSMNEAKKAAKETCNDCNSYDIFPIYGNAEWVNKTIGFLSGKRLKEYGDRQREKQHSVRCPRCRGTGYIKEDKYEFHRPVKGL